jgi:predicted transcriptional regulator of viral defense system
MSTAPAKPGRPAPLGPWADVASALSPGYVGGWTALRHWGLTGQRFPTTLFVTSRSLPRRQLTIGDVRFSLRRRPERVIFGTRRVWRERTPVSISDRERTLIDCLDDPSLAGGLRGAMDALTRYAARPDVDWRLVVDYADRLGSPAVFNRLGYIAEARGLDVGDWLIGACQARLGGTAGRLEPERPDVGETSDRWRLRVNVPVERFAPR